MANDELSSLSDEDGIDDNGDMQTVGHAIMDFDAEVFRFAQRGGGGKKRRRNRVQPTSPRSLNDALGAREKRYWLRIDGKLMLKTHLELLNTSLANTGTAILQLHMFDNFFTFPAHCSVALSSDNSEFVTPGEASKRLSR